MPAKGRKQTAENYEIGLTYLNILTWFSRFEEVNLEVAIDIDNRHTEDSSDKYPVFLVWRLSQLDMLHQDPSTDVYMYE